MTLSRLQQRVRKGMFSNCLLDEVYQNPDPCHNDRQAAAFIVWQAVEDSLALRMTCRGDESLSESAD